MTASSYIRGESIVHRTDARAKMIFSIFFSVSLFFAGNLLLLALVALLFILLKVDAVGWRYTWRTVRAILPIVVLIILLSPLEKRGGEPIWTIGGHLILTYEGLDHALLVSARLLDIALVMTLLVETVGEEEIVAAFSWMGLGPYACLFLSLVFRFIPSISHLWGEIRASLSLRIHEGRKRTPVFPFLVSLTVNTIRMAPRFSMSLEERGFGLDGRKKRRMRTSFVQGTEIFLAVLVPALMIASSFFW